MSVDRARKARASNKAPNKAQAVAAPKTSQASGSAKGKAPQPAPARAKTAPPAPTNTAPAAPAKSTRAAMTKTATAAQLKTAAAKPSSVEPSSVKPAARKAASPAAAPTERATPSSFSFDASASIGAAAVKPPQDFGLFADNLARIVDQGRKVLAAAVGSAAASDSRSELATNVADATRTLGVVAEQWLAKPDEAAKIQADLIGGLTNIWSQTLHRFAGEEAAPVVPNDPTDKRFAAPEWRANPFFDGLRQSYLLTSRWADEVVDRTEGLDPQMRAKAAFYVRLIASSLSPSNFVVTNPELLKATLEARGENLVRGLEMLAEDLSAGHGTLKIRQTDNSKFELGVDMASTPGKVVWRSPVMELIQYAPTTDKVYKRPVLLVPPWINKFYVLDLNPEKSFVRWAVAQGLTVFVVSWVNPDESQAEKGFDSYMIEGLFEALTAIEKATGERKVAAAGYCVGGTLLASTLAYMAEKGDDRIDSLTFFAAQVDFSDAGDMQIFVDEAKLAALDEAMSKTGYLDGMQMANTFNMLRPNELIWKYVIDNYVKGVEPAAFDLLAWNADSTRIPRANHLFYLRNCYLENNLTRGEMMLDGVKLNLRKVKLPIYEIGFKEDHIAPARSVFTGAKFFGGDVTFVLGGAGHIAGVVNPPDKHKYQYWTGGKVSGNFEDWTKTTVETKGSWWPHWLAWLTAQAPKMVAARVPGGGKLKPICDAPGDYVRVKA